VGTGSVSWGRQLYERLSIKQAHCHKAGKEYAVVVELDSNGCSGMTEQPFDSSVQLLT